ncbi:MAG: hypothetical protein RIQ81_763 [Pseudomonadota bacterium]|jgi:geranylgeranyl pyrophosphate synthase
MADVLSISGFSAFEQAWARLREKYAALPGDLGKALTYATENSGKLVRPRFCILSASAANSIVFNERLSWRGSLVASAACAVEMIHTYSLIHDDLPCMDDDDFRRGRPTLHKVFGEATALLAGDALLTDAFSLITRADVPSEGALSQVLCVRLLSAAAGGSGMVLGQALDMANSGGVAGANREDIERIHRLKTGALIGAACALGAAAAGAGEVAVEAFRAAGESTGLAFQVMDDLLDGKAGTGKTAGKDAVVGKATFLGLLGAEKGRALVDELTEGSVNTLKSKGFVVDEWEAFAKQLCHRQF